MPFEKPWFSSSEEQRHDDLTLQEGLEEYSSQKEDNAESSGIATLISTEKLSEKVELSTLYQWYATAMERRGREPLEENRFNYHFFEHGSTDPTFAYGNNHDGYALGVENVGVFIHTHFALRTLRGGYELLQNLGNDQNTPSLVAVTPDLAETLGKIESWHVVDLGGFAATFRGEEVKKVIAYNSHPDIEELAEKLFVQYMNDVNNITN